MDYLSGMKPVITVFETELQKKANLTQLLQNLVKQKELKGIVEYFPKSKKAAEVIRILRENGVEYQIRFDPAS